MDGESPNPLQPSAAEYVSTAVGFAFLLLLVVLVVFLLRRRGGSAAGHRSVAAVYLVQADDGAQLAGFTSLVEAQRALALLAGEERRGALNVNAVPLHDWLEDWVANR